MFIINESMSNCPVISLGASEFDELGTGTINMSGWAVSGSHRSTAHINGTRWGLKNMMEWAKFVAYKQNAIVSFNKNLLWNDHHCSLVILFCKNVITNQLSFLFFEFNFHPQKHWMSKRLFIFNNTTFSRNPTCTCFFN